MIEVWVKGTPDDNMPESMLVDTLENARRHPWWHARAKLALSALSKYGVTPPATVLDVGCGWGINLQALEKSGYSVAGLDISRRILEMLDLPGRRLIEADLNQEPPENAETYDALLALDVLEHLDDDQGVVRRFAKLLRPGGLAVISVPAIPELFSEFDHIQGHRRRYIPGTLNAAFDGTGLVVRQIFWWGAWMVPILRRMRKQTGNGHASASKTYADYLRLPPWPGPPLMALAYAWEQKKALLGKLATGTSLFAVAERL